MSHTEADRKAYNDDLDATIAKKLIAEWLRQFPQVGVINRDGKVQYYVIDSKTGQEVIVQPLDEVK